MNEIEKAIEHFHYGITHDIFSEPVTTYARLAIDALREKAEREKGGRTMNKLKPCPFCGGEAELYGVPHIPKGWDFIPRCKTTSCCGRQAKKYSNRETAIAAWNRRVILDGCENELIVRGEWKLYGNDDDSGMSYWCTACNFQLSEDLFYSGYKNGRWIENGVFKYCPNCGAKMEVEHGE